MVLIQLLLPAPKATESNAMTCLVGAVGYRERYARWSSFRTASPHDRAGVCASNK
jgi:hypothetical protein